MQWNSDVKFYEIKSFFYVFVYVQISFMSQIHKTYFTFLVLKIILKRREQLSSVFSILACLYC